MDCIHDQADVYSKHTLNQKSSKIQYFQHLHSQWHREKRLQGVQRLQRGGLLDIQKGLSEIGKGDWSEPTCASAISPAANLSTAEYNKIYFFSSQKYSTGRR